MEVIAKQFSNKIKNLTLGTKYEVLEEIEDKYILENNNGIAMPYKKAIFEVVEKFRLEDFKGNVELVNMRVVDYAGAEEEDLVGILDEIDAGNIFEALVIDGLRVRVKDKTFITDKENTSTIRLHNSCISCGVYEIEPINNTAENLVDMCQNLIDSGNVDAEPNEIKEFILTELLPKLLTDMLEYLLKDNKDRQLIGSTNITNNMYWASIEKALQNIAEEYEVHMVQSRNGNSGNDICTFILVNFYY